MTKIDENLLTMAKTIKAYCQEIGKANLGGDCCNGCVFAQGGCVLNACPEERMKFISRWSNDKDRG